MSNFFIFRILLQCHTQICIFLCNNIKNASVESMSDPMSVSLAALSARQAQRQGKEILAQQVLSDERFEESVDTGFNPGAVERQQARFNRFRTLENRTHSSSKEQK